MNNNKKENISNDNYWENYYFNEGDITTIPPFNITKRIAKSYCSEKEDGLAYLSMFNSDTDVIFTAYQNNTGSFKYVSESIKKNQDFIKWLVNETKNADCAQYIDKSLLKDRDFFANLLANDKALFETEHDFKQDKKMVMIYLESRYGSFSYVDESLKNDKDIILAALKGGNFLTKEIKRLSEFAKITDDELKEVLMENPNILPEIPKKSKIWKDGDFLLNLIKISLNIMSYVPTNLYKDTKFMAEVFSMRSANPLKMFHWKKQTLEEMIEILEIVKDCNGLSKYSVVYNNIVEHFEKGVMNTFKNKEFKEFVESLPEYGNVKELTSEQLNDVLLKAITEYTKRQMESDVKDILGNNQAIKLVRKF